MSDDLWLVIALIAVGTFAIRAVPLLWMRRHLQRRHLARGPQRMPANEAEGASDATEPTEAAASIPGWLSILAPLMIAAMFGVSVVPAAIDSGSAWLASISGVVATLLTWRRTRSLGWPVFTGVLVYGLVVVLDGVMF